MFCRAHFVPCRQGDVADYYTGSMVLGDGAAGRVFKVKSISSGFTRAMKRIPKSDGSRTAQEIAIMKSLDHPNIVKLFETFEDAEHHYLVMELCEGGTLLDWIIETGHFSETQVALVMHQLFCAVRFWQELGISHNDLNADNVMLLRRRSPDSNVAKVIDFGVAHRSVPRKNLDVLGCGQIMQVLLRWGPDVAASGAMPNRQNVHACKVDPSMLTHISADGRDLLEMLLDGNMTAKDAIRHRWVRHVWPDPSPLLEVFVDRLRTFLSHGSLKKAALHAIADRLDDTEISDLRACFSSFDRHSDGFLSTSEVKVALRKIHAKVPSDLQRLMENVDTDGVGVLDYTSFLAVMITEPSYTAEKICWEAFQSFNRPFSKGCDSEAFHDFLASVRSAADTGVEKFKLCGLLERPGVRLAKISAARKKWHSPKPKKPKLKKVKGRVETVATTGGDIADLNDFSDSASASDSDGGVGEDSARASKIDPQVSERACFNSTRRTRLISL